ncbi:MAG: DUF4410 domain-containing protein [Clostridiales bacterium]|nr:DUF4410 domain-containing protein [Clostridiales bacterium]
MQKELKLQESAKLICLLIFLVVISYGCASTKATHNTIQPSDQGVEFVEFDNLEIKATKADEVKLQDHDMERIVGEIITKLKSKCPECFNEINENCDKNSTLCINVNFTRYDKGNAFARAMLAGLGQMHIDALVTVEDKDIDKMIAEYEVKKTFAWGGIYGGATKIEDIEPAFADAIVSLLLQEKE